MLTLLEAAKKTVIPAKYVLLDSWFSSPSTLHAVKEIGYDVIGMVKKTPKMFFRYNGEAMSLFSIYNRNKKRRGRSLIIYLCHHPTFFVKLDCTQPVLYNYQKNPSVYFVDI